VLFLRRHRVMAAFCFSILESRGFALTDTFAGNDFSNISAIVHSLPLQTGLTLTPVCRKLRSPVFSGRYRGTVGVFSDPKTTCTFLAQPVIAHVCTAW
jgi:hypothetical protein